MWKIKNSVKTWLGQFSPSPYVLPGSETDFVVHPALTGRTGISVNQGRRNHRSRGAIAFTDFIRFVNPISNRGAEYADQITNCPLPDFYTFLRACKLMGLKGQYILRRSLSWLQGLPSVVLSLIMKEDHTQKRAK